MTTVTSHFRSSLAWLGLLAVGGSLSAHQVSAPQVSTGAPHDGPAVNLYLQLSSVGLDPALVYHVHDYALSRSSIDISLNDGDIAFTHDVAGRITGAIFEGDGEILLPPPDQVERASLALFTGSAILEEGFSSAYFRFNDDSFSDLRASARSVDGGLFAEHWNPSAKSLAQIDALRIFLTLVQSSDAVAANTSSRNDRYFHARMQGRKLSSFDVFYDSLAPEQITAGQVKTSAGQSFYDTWMSFSAKRAGDRAHDNFPGGNAEEEALHPRVRRYRIQAEVQPPMGLSASALLSVDAGIGGTRTILFELSRSLTVDRVEADGQPIEFIHNQAIEGSQLSRRGNDLVAVVFRKPLVPGQKLDLRFLYHGDVLADAGGGLLAVGSRGIWYPNLGLAMSDYDLTFTCPKGWTLIATGKRTVDPTLGDGVTSATLVSHWVSERPIPVAGFNLGRYKEASAQAGAVQVFAYAAPGVEREFPAAQDEILSNLPQTPRPILAPIKPPVPANHVQEVANESAQAIEFFTKCFGPFPYSSLSLAQMPGSLSQGWPGMVYLSSFSFLSDEDRARLRMTKLSRTLSDLIPAHEIAHQWWGGSGRLERLSRPVAGRGPGQL